MKNLEIIWSVILMPTYRAYNQKTKKELTFTCSIAEMIQWEKDNPGWEVLPGKPLIHTGFAVGESKSDGWRDVLKQVKKNHPKSNIKV